MKRIEITQSCLFASFLFFFHTSDSLRDDDSHGEQGRVRERCNRYVELLETKCPRHVYECGNELTLWLIFMKR